MSYPYDALTKREAFLQGPNVVVPEATPLTVYDENSSVGVVKLRIGGETMAGLMRKSAYEPA